MSKKLKQVEKDLQQLKNQSEKVEQELKELSPEELEKITGGAVFETGDKINDTLLDLFHMKE